MCEGTVKHHGPTEVSWYPQVVTDQKDSAVGQEAHSLVL
uniref:Uncharacterized protein n=1 Tax=Anguilla anguilla TaxID=7936 RepID=A0A0E9SEN4_ANGAN